MILVLTIWGCPCVELFLVLLEEGVCYNHFVLCQRTLLKLKAKLCQPLPCFILYSKAKLSCYSRYLLSSYFYIPVPYDEKDIFFVFFFVVVVVSSRRSCRSSQDYSASASSALLVGAQTWIPMMLNGLPLKRTVISFCHF